MRVGHVETWGGGVRRRWPNGSRGAGHSARTPSRGKIMPRYIPRRSPMARCSRDARPGARRWQVFASCIPEGASDGKSAPPWQDIAAVYPKRAGFGKICAPCIRKAPQIAFRECIARRSCQGGALFAAQTPQIMHGARILPSRRCRQTARAPATPAPAPSARHIALKRCSARKGRPAEASLPLNSRIALRRCGPLRVFRAAASRAAVALQHCGTDAGLRCLRTIRQQRRPSALPRCGKKRPWIGITEANASTPLPAAGTTH